ncbi:MAG: hypothetical protein Q9220_006901 [cf. Caloplaca sp. 1 TL-2023]
MAQKVQSLHEYLQQNNPVLDCTDCSSGSYSTYAKRTYDAPKSLEHWTDFNIESLKHMYNGILHNVLQKRYKGLQNRCNIAKMPYCRITDENSLESLLGEWNHAIITEALAKAQADPVHGSGPPIYMCKGGQALFPHIETSKNKKKLYPDWAGAQPTTEVTGRPKNILPGDTNFSSKWKSSKIQPGPFKSGKESSWAEPLKQIFTYCVRSNARYGYVITDKDLLAIRVRPVESINSNALRKSAAVRARRRGIIEFKIIPWDTAPPNGTIEDSSGLTINLALWWLHLMAASGSRVEDHYLPLKEALRSQNIDGSAEGADDEQYADDGRTESSDTTYTSVLGDKDSNRKLRSATSDVRSRSSKSSFHREALSSSFASSQGTKRSREDEPQEIHQVANGKQKRKRRRRA